MCNFMSHPGVFFSRCFFSQLRWYGVERTQPAPHHTSEAPKALSSQSKRFANQIKGWDNS